MLTRRRFALLVLGVVALALPSRPVAAQDVPKIATVNLVRVFGEMQETKDLQQKMDAERKSLEDEKANREKQLNEIKQQRTLFTEGSEDFNKKNKELIDKMVSLKAWQELVNYDQLRQRKAQFKGLFDKIEQVTKEIAEQRKIDIVLVEHRPDWPSGEIMEQLNLEQVRGVINQRTVIYNNGKFDITADVVTALDKKYKEKR
jgi:Skp family chaperone for outer membrane proteins